MKLNLIDKKYPYYIVWYKQKRYIAYDYEDYLCMQQAVIGEVWYVR